MDSFQKQEVFFALERYGETNSLTQVKFTLLTSNEENYQKKIKNSLNFSDDDNKDDDFEGLLYISTPSRWETKEVEYSAEEDGIINQTTHDNDKVLYWGIKTSWHWNFRE